MFTAAPVEVTAVNGPTVAVVATCVSETSPATGVGPVALLTSVRSVSPAAGVIAPERAVPNSVTTRSPAAAATAGAVVVAELALTLLATARTGAVVLTPFHAPSWTTAAREDENAHRYVAGSPARATFQ
jgi:hypothetical protein